MRIGRPRFSERLKQRALGLTAAALVLPMAAGIAGTAVAGAAPVAHRAPAGGFEEVMVPSAMGDIKVQIQWAAHGGNAALYLLDGLRARNDRNAWTFETNALDQFRNDNVTLVMPVGGESSFYTDWMSPSNFNGQKGTYKWETFLTQELPAYLETRGVSRSNNGVLGLSMGGSAALTLAAHHRDQFKFAGSLSGYLNISAPGMREAIRVAMLDAGRYNVDAMWGPPWNKQWLRNDPFVFAPQLKGLSMYVSAASGLPGAHDNPRAPIDYFNTANGMALEALSLANTRAFQVRLGTLGIPATYSFPARGTHAWKYWESELWNARPQILSALNA
ncbi:diacylglycerol O-acyltransferase/trehalose O-mycolyltransferase [Rhodococcus sp. PvR044]|jgi:diacylglycerol O-acyltransferase / trehalose O-mycolyltransferase|uniref:alpha/beta hydrolase n=1 Tax=Rhodococcus TaxID=1827 RepID=UPI000BC5E3BA|nr:MULTISPECIES: alpha/beta hydrolase family protein [Rhodococcus]MBP1161225.1 diacylglycerol O-acyltransferase/trehalose O-mycolyltransferase [Rhodococcus sp. PvR099]MCZ4559047.1 alpha/beta hydrolase family protein [Rhodococcus maanshanensis]PTR44830.1 diacylglycerol O-acyltransferase/trehalose O-mycolyltransferase [Rhodococcus sp. OK611]SNX93849.1 diacylglycerol O-acyltransferase / trehalose O-mycolyltransferase [Rhodococcus sp. OK270]